MELALINKENMPKDFVENLHSTIFDSFIESDYFRYDSCLFAKEGDELISYVMVREVSSETAEMAWGGTSKKHRGLKSVDAFKLFVDYLHKDYENVGFQTWNRNYPMIKLGLSYKFVITGTRASNNGDLFVIFNKKRGE